MKTFFTADTHFFHERAATEFRGFQSAEEMNELIVANWNAKVKHGDLVYHLGDFALGNPLNTVKIASRLNGIKHLICGNHDKIGWLAHKSKKFAAIAQVYTDHFDNINNAIHITVCGRVALLSHLPYIGDHEGQEERYLDKRLKPGHESVNIHGHIHDLWVCRQTDGFPPMLNVGVDVWGYSPVSTEELEPYITE
jgi:calcineurin-like phosphoesterase family protein